MKYASLSAEELVKECAESQNAEAWEEFVRRFQKPISLVVRRVASRYGDTSLDLVKDLTQDTFLKVVANNCRVLRDFEPQRPDAFYGMVKVMAANVVRDHFRVIDTEKRPKIADVELSEVEPFVSDGNAAGAARIEREILMREIDRVLITNKSPTAARDRDIFWLHYRHGFTAAEIARIKSFGLSVKGVESALLKLKRLLCQALVERSDRVVAPDPVAPAETFDHRESSGDLGSPGSRVSSQGPEGNPQQNPLAKGEGQT